MWQVTQVYKKQKTFSLCVDSVSAHRRYCRLYTCVTFFLCDESEKCIYAQERTSVRGKTVVPPQCVLSSFLRHFCLQPSIVIDAQHKKAKKVKIEHYPSIKNNIFYIRPCIYIFQIFFQQVIMKLYCQKIRIIHCIASILKSSNI